MIANDLIAGDDPRLAERCAPWDFEADGDPTETIHRLIEIVQHKGLGLAAPQIGIMRRIFVMRRQDPRLQVIWGAVINPRIIDLAPEKAVEREGCLSWPGLFLKVERPRGVRAICADIAGRPYQTQLVGLDARCFLHEFDHLEGRTLKTIMPGSFAAAERALAKRAG